MDQLSQFVGMLTRRQTQQQTVVVLFQPEEVQLRGVRQQRAIVVVHIAVDIIIGGIESANALQKLNL